MYRRHMSVQDDDILVALAGELVRDGQAEDAGAYDDDPAVLVLVFIHCL